MKYEKTRTIDPIRGLTLEKLTSQIHAYHNGYISDFARTAEAMESCDDILKNVATKRKKSVTRHGWEILVENDSPAALRQREALDYFYRHMSCSNVLKPDERGGVQLFMQQMMDAVGKGFAVHEIEWKTKVNGTSQPLKAANFEELTHLKLLHGRSLTTVITADLVFVPLWYFEATTGRLRILTLPGSLVGEDLEEGQWLVTTGDALMVACSRAFLFKHYPLQSWLDYSQKFGLPGVRAIAGGGRGTPEFAEMEETLRKFLEELAIVTTNAESIDIIDLKGTGSPPFAELVERMDRTMAALWRGADLSTISRDKGYGATLQEQEARILEQDDARFLSEHLNTTIDRWVLTRLFGPSTKQLARIKILVTPQDCTPHDISIDSFLLQHGARLSLNETLERYGRVQARPGEDALTAKGSKSDASQDATQKGLSDFGKLRNNIQASEAYSDANNLIQNAKPDPRTINSMKPPLNYVSLSNTASKLANSQNSFTLASQLDEYLQLTPKGVFLHARGFQNVDDQSLDSLVKHFNSFLSRLGRRFAGIPFYVGHPDVPGFENIYTDKKAYGWIMDLQVRDDGLYGRAKWSEAGRSLIENGHFKFLSPYWQAKSIGVKDGRGIFSPTALISVGLTNDPNLPVLPLANSDAVGNIPLDETLVGSPVPVILSRNELYDSHSTLPANNAAPPPAGAMENSSRIPDGSNSTAVTNLERQLQKLETAFLKQDDRIKELNERLITALLDNAIAESRIHPIERDQWYQTLTSDFPNGCADLANIRPSTPRLSVSKDLVRRPIDHGEKKQNRALKTVEEIMRSTGTSYHQAWLKAKEENPELF